MIRVVLPAPLCTLAGVERELRLEVAGRPRSAPCSTRWRPAIRRCAARSAIR